MHFQTFDAKPLITNCALDIICKSSMGCNIDAQHNAANSPYIWAIGRYSEIQFEKVVSMHSIISTLNLLAMSFVHTLVQSSHVEQCHIQTFLQQEIQG